MGIQYYISNYAGFFRGGYSQQNRKKTLKCLPWIRMMCRFNRGMAGWFFESFFNLPSSVQPDSTLTVEFELNKKYYKHPTYTDEYIRILSIVKEDAELNKELPEGVYDVFDFVFEGDARGIFANGICPKNTLWNQQTKEPAVAAQVCCCEYKTKYIFIYFTFRKTKSKKVFCKGCGEKKMCERETS